MPDAGLLGVTPGEAGPSCVVILPTLRGGLFFIHSNVSQAV